MFSNSFDVDDSERVVLYEIWTSALLTLFGKQYNYVSIILLTILKLFVDCYRNLLPFWGLYFLIVCIHPRV